MSSTSTTADIEPKAKEQTGTDKGTLNCMPDNPFIPDSWFGSPTDKMKAHLIMFVGMVIVMRGVGIMTCR
ncbi:hypothetical protein Ocin01_04449 [Orchesella cincta]|uniref:Uncharacterized protein n=1 Tax=Orchesella cincta TaxID=48709 RepID=A0A1D2NAD4_ORCCI|nr:hypothetical protein Ocin01_04449 [Orchesella cincta]